MEPLNPPSVAIDGNSVRRIREEKRLTQFYVSKVVAVTTDTVSRWENNRYPTIMRDNALKLAEALEVDLSEILKKDDAGEISDKSHPSQTTNSNKLIHLLLFISVVLIGLFFLFQQFNSPAVPVLQAKRQLPAYAAPGSRVLIQADLSSEKPLKGMILKETFPPGWHLLESEPVVSHIDTDAGVARWIFRQPLLETRVFYILEVPEDTDAGSDLQFVGELIANPEGQRFAAILQSVGAMQVKPFHWADSNGDQVIDDVEILELSDLTEEAKSLHLDWDLIETIWEAGAYRWSTEQKQFVPARPLFE
ncbi:MAG: helix-turn-helix transcriptional regulator [Desulfuromusa sp.]|nr:helix-turn-helix transcriptional regulator [Desulfuromusa sp.]